MAKLTVESAQEYYLDGDDVAEQLEHLAALLREGGWTSLEFLEVVDGTEIRARTTRHPVQE